MDLRRHAAELGARAASLAARLRKASAKAIGRTAEGLGFLTARAQSRCRSGGKAIGAIAARTGALAAEQAGHLRKSAAKATARAAEGLGFLAAWAQSRCRSNGKAIGAIAARMGALAAERAGILQRRWQRVRSVSLPAAGARLAAWYRAARQARLVETTRHRLATTIEGLGKSLATAARNAAPRLASVRQRGDTERRRIGAAAGSGRDRIATALRNGPLAPALARLERCRLARLRPPAGRYRVDVATAGSRRVALGGALLLVALLALPAFAERALINDLIFVFTMLALAQYWNLLAGYAGLVSIGQQAFVGLGGYLLFALTIHAGIDPLLAILLAGLLAGLLALPTAFVVFRLQGAYFAIGTWVMAEVYRLVFAQFRQLGGGTGTSLPPFVTNEVAGIAWVKALLGVRTSVARDVITYWVALLLAAGTVLAVYLLLRSRHGLALSAIRDGEPAAESVGVDSFRTKLYVYIGTAVGTGMVGALIYLQKARISPDAAFSVLDWTAYVVFIVVIGGIGTIEGPIVGVLVFYLLQSNLAHYGSWYLILLGLLAIVVMLFTPKGIWGYLAERNALVVFPLRRKLSENAARQNPSQERRRDAPGGPAAP
jgi:branched-chain amino acid transport system permease protein